MAAQLTAKPDSQPRLELTVRGRVYPHELRGKATANPSRNDCERDERVSQRIWETLPWSKQRLEDFKSDTEILQSYEVCLSILRRHHEAAGAMFRAVCDCNTTTEIDATDRPFPTSASRETVVQSILLRGGFKNFKSGKALAAELMTEPSETIHRRLSQTLMSSTRNLVANVFATMDRFVDKSVFGVMEWLGDSVCKFYYFDERFSESWEMREVDLGWLSSSTKEISVQHRGRQQHVRQRHEHHLIEAKSEPVEGCSVQIPERVQRVIESIPEWLRAETRVVSGVQIVSEVRSEKILDRKVEAERRETRTVPLPPRRKEGLRYDPALEIDGFVLTGWDDADMTADSEQLARATSRARRRREVEVFGPRVLNSWGWLRFLLGASLVCWGLALLVSPLFAPLVVLFLAAGMWQSYVYFRSAAQYCRMRPPLAYLFFGMTGAFCGWLGLASMIASPFTTNYLGVIGIFLASISRPLVRFADEWLPHAIHTMLSTSRKKS